MNINSLKIFRSFLGHLYEGFFKLGFGAVDIEQIKQFLFYNNQNIATLLKDKNIFVEIIEKYLQYLLQQQSIQLQSANIPCLFKFNDIAKNFIEWSVDYTIRLGYAQGSNYRYNYINRLYGIDINKIKFDLEEESNKPGYWKNSDLMFSVNDILFVVEIKTDNMLDILKTLSSSVFTNNEVEYNTLKEKNLVIPFQFYGVPLNLSLATTTLLDFINGIKNYTEIFYKTTLYNIDIKASMQAISYATSYLTELTEEQVEKYKKIKIEILHPFTKLFSPIFDINVNDFKKIDKDFIENTIPKIYKHAKIFKTDSVLKNVLSDDEFDKQFSENHIKDELQEINNINGKHVKISAENIKTARDDVEERINNFYKTRKNDKGLKTLCLFHSAGSGKTTSIRKLIQKEITEQEKICVFYFSTRKIIVAREYVEYQNLDFHTYMPTESEAEQRELIEYVKMFLINEGSRQKKIENLKKYGNLSQIGNYIDSLLVENSKYSRLAVFTTLQSLLHAYGRKETAMHLYGVIKSLINNNYKIFIVIDEFFGDERGLYAIDTIFRNFHNLDIFFFILDANGYSANVLQLLLTTYKKHNMINSCIYLLPFKSEYSFNFDYHDFSINNIECYAKHGFVSKLGYIKLIPHFVYVKSKENMIDKISNIIITTLGEQSKEYPSLIFYQNKEKNKQLQNKLKISGFESITVNTTTRYSEDEINKGKYNFIITTSTASRGVSFKNVKDTVVIFTNNNIEENMVEIIQTISRGRGNPKIEEQEERHIHFIYVIEENYINKVLNSTILPEEVQNDSKNKELLNLYFKYKFLRDIRTLNDIVCQTIVQFVKTPEENKNVLVPVPTFLSGFYVPAEFDQITSTRTLIKDSLIEICSEWKNEENSNIYYGSFIDKISGCIKFTIRNENTRFMYIHPYLIPTSMKNKKIAIPFVVDISIDKKDFITVIDKVVDVINKSNMLQLFKKEQLNKLRQMKQLLNVTSQESSKINYSEKLYVLIPIYTKLLIDYLTPGKGIYFVTNPYIYELETVGKYFNVVTCGDVYDKISSTEPCIILLTKEFSPFLLESKQQKFTPQFIKNLLDNLGRK